VQFGHQWLGPWWQVCRSLLLHVLPRLLLLDWQLSLPLLRLFIRLLLVLFLLLLLLTRAAFSGLVVHLLLLLLLPHPSCLQRPGNLL
jgi:hypothetical protein